MTAQTEAPSHGVDIDELLQMLGAPPVLSSESLESYKEVMAQFLEELALDDFMGLLLIKELTDSSWEMMRYSRYMNLVMNRRLGPRLAFQEKRRREAAQGNDTIAKGAREIKREPPTCPEDLLDDLVEEIDAILLRPDADELDHLDALEVGIVYHQRIDKLFVTAAARRNNVLAQIKRYRGGMGQRLRRVSDYIVQGGRNVDALQPKQVQAASIPLSEQQR